MSKKLIEMKIVRKLILLLQRGLSERQIAQQFADIPSKCKSF